MASKMQLEDSVSQITPEEVKATLYSLYTSPFPEDVKTTLVSYNPPLCDMKLEFPASFKAKATRRRCGNPKLRPIKPPDGFTELPPDFDETYLREDMNGANDYCGCTTDFEPVCEDCLANLTTVYYLKILTEFPVIFESRASRHDIRAPHKLPAGTVKLPDNFANSYEAWMKVEPLTQNLFTIQFVSVDVVYIRAGARLPPPPPPLDAKGFPVCFFADALLEEPWAPTSLPSTVVLPADFRKTYDAWIKLVRIHPCANEPPTARFLYARKGHKFHTYGD